MKKRGPTGSVYVALYQQFDVIRHDFLSGASVAAHSRTYLEESSRPQRLVRSRSDLSVGQTSGAVFSRPGRLWGVKSELPDAGALASVNSSKSTQDCGGTRRINR